MLRALFGHMPARNRVIVNYPKLTRLTARIKPEQTPPRNNKTYLGSATDCVCERSREFNLHEHGNVN